MIRSLAGLWHELTNDTYQWSPEAIVEFFRHIAPNMQSPLPKENAWFEASLEASFYKGASGYTSPNAHRGVDLDLQRAMMLWAVRWEAAQQEEAA